LKNVTSYFATNTRIILFKNDRKTTFFGALEDCVRLLIFTNSKDIIGVFVAYRFANLHDASI